MRREVVATMLVMVLVGLGVALFGTSRAVSPNPDYIPPSTIIFSTTVSDSSTVTVAHICLCPPASGECPCADPTTTTSSYLLNYLGVAIFVSGALGLILGLKRTKRLPDPSPAAS